MSRFLLDTNTWIAFLRQSNPQTVARIKSHSPSDILLCSVVLSELLYGANHSPEKFRATNLARVNLIRNDHQSIPFDDKAAEIVGALGNELALAGTPIGPLDFLISAIALANDLTLVTANVKEFQRVPNLKIENWC